MRFLSNVWKKLRSYKASDHLFRQSFDRFCDDLAQHLFSFLPIHHKIRFECVSKQFRRLIFNEQFVLTISPRSSEENTFCNKIIKQLNTSDENVLFQYMITVDEKAFESVLKKFQYINSIRISSATNNEKLLQLITKYCNCLKRIEFDFTNISHNTLTQFGLKCGQKLRNIRFWGTISTRTKNKLLHFCPNIESLYDIDIKLLTDSQISMNKLTKVESLKQIDSKQLMQKFVDKYKSRLKQLHIDLNESKDNNSLMIEISRLQCLQSLKFDYTTDTQMGQTFAHNLKTIALKCNQMKFFEFFQRDLKSDVSPHLSYQILNVMKYFTKIENIELSFIDNNQHFTEISCKLFNECKRLTRLSLSYPKLSQTFFKDIDLHLSQLTHLYLGTDGEYFDITDADMHSLAKLTKLKALSLDCCLNSPKFDEISDEGFCHFVTNCPNIESVRLRKAPNITHKSIETIISLAEQKPKLTFRFFIGSKRGYLYTYQVVDMFRFANLPNNLDIMVSEEEDDDIFAFDFYQ